MSVRETTSTPPLNKTIFAPPSRVKFGLIYGGIALFFVLGLISLGGSSLGIASAVGSISQLSQASALSLAASAGGLGLVLGLFGGGSLLASLYLKRRSSLERTARYNLFKEHILTKYSDQEGYLLTREEKQLLISREGLSEFMDKARDAFQKGATSYSEDNGRLLMCSALTEDGRMKLYYQNTHEELLGKGSFGQVKAVTNLTTGRDNALKEIRNPSLHKHLLRVGNSIYSHEGIEGIGMPPRTHLLDKGTKLLGDRYQGALRKNDDAPVYLGQTEGLRCAFQTLSALARGHDIGLVFTDRKAGNVLYKRGERYDLSDFDGYVTRKQVIKLGNSEDLPVTFTTTYMAFDDAKAFVEKHEAGRMEETYHILEKMDVLGMGITLWEVFTGAEFPLIHTTDFYANLGDEKVEEKLESSVSNEKIRRFLLSMLHPDYKQRPTAQRALETLTTCLSQDYRHLMAEFKEQEALLVNKLETKRQKQH